MKLIFNFLKFLLIIPLLCSCKPGTNEPQEKREIRNIILLIGDGMGLPAVSAAISSSPVSLNFERFRFLGFTKTSSLTDFITDSAAAGTAISSGKKTENGVLGKDTLGNNFRSILEIAEEHGLSTGLVSTSSVTHATPAAFVAHNISRNNYEEIAVDFLNSGVDVLIGGGINHFCHRADNLNLIDSFRVRGYEADTSLESGLSSVSPKLVTLTAPVHNPYFSEGRADMLPRATQKAIDILSLNSRGFFLMIEGSQIDWSEHDNNAENVILETLDFDRAIAKALDFAEKDGHTLVIVTADHETGGVTITGGDMGKNDVILNFSTTHHTAVMVPVYAYGPGAEKFAGIYENTAIFDKMKELYGF